ncbi:MAG: CRTAC1 family protein, partial [Vicinamibacterales bacterium]
NNGDGTFADVTAKAGVAGGAAEWSTSTGFLDYDHDGDLDLYVANYVDFRVDENPYCGFRRDGYRMYCNPTMFDGVADRLFRNNGDGTFTDVSKAAGVANSAGKGLGVAVCDYDRDGDTDIYVANDMVRNFLYRNNGDGTFTDVAYAAGVGFDLNGKPQAGMGVDCADIDGNTLPDIFVTNFSEELNTLYKNAGGGIFEDATTAAGLGSGFEPLGFGTKLFDADNDGDLDIYVTNGHVIENVQLYQPKLTYAQKDLLYENLGGRFRDITARAGPALQATRVGRGLAVADFDNDGSLDVVISSVGRAPVLLKNLAAKPGHWLTIKAEGTKSNRFGLGATVTVTAGGRVQVLEINNVASYLSSNDIRLHVGLGAAATIEKIEIVWPSGAKQTLTDVKADQILTIKES